MKIIDGEACGPPGVLNLDIRGQFGPERKSCHEDDDTARRVPRKYVHHGSYYRHSCLIRTLLKNVRDNYLFSEKPVPD